MKQGTLCHASSLLAENSKRQERKKMLEMQIKKKSDAVTAITGSRLINWVFRRQLMLLLNSVRPQLQQLDEHLLSDVATLLLYAKYIAQGYAHYRSPFQKLYQKISPEVIEQISQHEGCEFFSLITDVEQMHHLVQEIDDFDETTLKLRNFYASFQTGRTHAYQDYQNGECVTVLNPETQLNEEYEIYNITAKRSDGSTEKSLVGHIYSPKSRSDYPIVFVCWRGSSGKESWLSDMQPTAGVESFFAHEPEILRQISKAIFASYRMQNQKINIFVSGHSLGGALTQMCYNSLQRALCRDEAFDKNFVAQMVKEFSGFKAPARFLHALSYWIKQTNKITLDPAHVASMHLGVWNSPGVFGAVAESSNECAKQLKDRFDITQNAYFVMVDGDMVQTSGVSTVLSQLDKNKAHVELLNLNTGQASCNLKVAGVMAGMFTGGIVGSILPVGPYFGAAGGYAATSSLMGYAVAVSHRARFFDETGRISCKTSGVKSYLHNTSHDANTLHQSQRKLQNKSKLMGIFSLLSSQFNILNKRGDIENFALTHAASCIQRTYQQYRKKSAKTHSDSQSLKI